jgi:hypothetical protein
MNDPFARLPVVPSFTVQAISIDKVGQPRVQADSTPAWLGFSINVSGHLLGRAVIIPRAEIPAV